ncbi:MAG: dihydrodipicolinate reductase C-terminal domain-containing protein [Ornithinimicrobium sp.]
MARSIGVFGRGRLGSLIADALQTSPDMECAWLLGRNGIPTAPVDVAIDVSHADAVGDHVAWATDTGTDLVIGTTGWPVQVLRGSGQFSGVLIAPNFSLSMALMRRFAVVLGGYAELSPSEVDFAVTETHHRGKVDAPSGSASLLADALAQGAGRPVDSIAVSSLRMGTVIGRHEVRFENDTEAIVLTHQTHSRQVYATSALLAASWISGRRGVFTTDDWAADRLDDLFATTPRGATLPTTHTHTAHTGDTTPPHQTDSVNNAVQPAQESS